METTTIENLKRDVAPDADIKVGDQKDFMTINGARMTPLETDHALQLFPVGELDISKYQQYVEEMHSIIKDAKSIEIIRGELFRGIGDYITGTMSAAYLLAIMFPDKQIYIQSNKTLDVNTLYEIPPNLIFFEPGEQSESIPKDRVSWLFGYGELVKLEGEPRIEYNIKNKLITHTWPRVTSLFSYRMENMMLNVLDMFGFEVTQEMKDSYINGLPFREEFMDVQVNNNVATISYEAKSFEGKKSLTPDSLYEICINLKNRGYTPQIILPPETEENAETNRLVRNICSENKYELIEGSLTSVIQNTSNSSLFITVDNALLHFVSKLFKQRGKTQKIYKIYNPYILQSAQAEFWDLEGVNNLSTKMDPIDLKPQDIPNLMSQIVINEG